MVIRDKTRSPKVSLFKRVPLYSQVPIYQWLLLSTSSRRPMSSLYRDLTALKATIKAENLKASEPLVIFHLHVCKKNRARVWTSSSAKQDHFFSPSFSLNTSSSISSHFSALEINATFLGEPDENPGRDPRERAFG